MRSSDSNGLWSDNDDCMGNSCGAMLQVYTKKTVTMQEANDISA